MIRILALTTVMAALIVGGFALAQGPYRQSEQQPNATVEARTLTQTKAQESLRQLRGGEPRDERRELRLEERLEQRQEQRALATQTARHERAMLQECEDGEPTVTATRQQRGPQANW